MHEQTALRPNWASAESRDLGFLRGLLREIKARRLGFLRRSGHLIATHVHSRASCVRAESLKSSVARTTRTIFRTPTAIMSARI